MLEMCPLPKGLALANSEPASAPMLETPALSMAASLVPRDTESFDPPVPLAQHVHLHDREVADAAMRCLQARIAVQDVELAIGSLFHAQLLKSAKTAVCPLQP